MNLLTKIMQFIHRILGTALSILFLVWFLSGLVMIYHTFPRADRADKRAKMDILSLENLPSLDQIEKRLPQNERISHVTLNSYLGQTVFHLRTEKGSYDIPADSTERLPVIDWNQIFFRGQCSGKDQYSGSGICQRDNQIPQKCQRPGTDSFRRRRSTYLYPAGKKGIGT